MLYILIFLAILILGFFLFRSEFFTPALVFAIGLCGILLLVSFIKTTDYFEFRYYDNPTQTYQLGLLPYEDTYINFDGDNYTYCEISGNNHVIKTINRHTVDEISIEYIDTDDMPHLEYNSVIKKSVLIKKPSFWLDIISWDKYKDVSVGETFKVIKTNLSENYRFFIPKDTN